MANDESAVVYFTSPTCQPCKKMGPIIDEIAAERSDVSFMLVDVSEQPEVAKEWDVTSVPTFVRVDEGQQGTRVVGAYPKAVLRRRLDV